MPPFTGRMPARPVRSTAGRLSDLPLDGQALLSQNLLERLTLYPFHHQILLTLLGGAMAQVADDPRVRNLRQQRCLPLKTFGVLAEPQTQKLDRDPRLRLPISASKNCTHPARGDLGFNLKASGDGLPGHGAKSTLDAPGD